MLVVAVAAGCADSDEDRALERMLAARRSMSTDERAGIATRIQEVAGASTSATGAPVGYPEGFPLVPGYTVVSGSVDPGVVRTATLTYELDAAVLADALVASAGTEGFTLAGRESSPGGTVRLRFERDGAEVSVAIRSDGERAALQAIERGGR